MNADENYIYSNKVNNHIVYACVSIDSLFRMICVYCGIEKDMSVVLLNNINITWK